MNARFLPILLAWVGLASAPAQVGVNLDFLTDWSPAWTFVDGFKHARTWLPQRTGGTHPWDTGESLDLAADGNVRSLKPGQAAAALLFWDLQGHFPAGEYTCLFDGRGEIDFRGAGQIKSKVAGKYVVAVDPSKGGVILRVTQTDPADPVRNVRFFMPGFESGKQLFHPSFLQSLQPFRVIRFMNWQRTNSNPSGRWADRTTPTSLTQRGPQGVSLEAMIALANTTGADPWFCLPHGADDDYVRNFAALVKKQLLPSRKIYVEYSNEVWNGIFPQSRYAREEGLRLALSSNPYEAQMRFYSQRSVEIFRIWEQVFGGRDRLVRVLASQSVNLFTARTILSWKNAAASADALAVAPYFGGGLGSSPVSAGLEIADILAACEADIAAQQRYTRENAALARSYRLQLIAYEGGQHLVGVGAQKENPELTRKFIAANEHPRMGDLYRLDLQEWTKSGGGLMVTYALTGTYNKHGSWGLLRWQDQHMGTAPKYQALLTKPDPRAAKDPPR
ncbi:MAG: hypothetical protein ACOYMS_03240 [Terrimicrobiaceae bacterium]